MNTILLADFVAAQSHKAAVLYSFLYKSNDYTKSKMQVNSYQGDIFEFEHVFNFY